MIDEKRYQRLLKKEEDIRREILRLEQTIIGASKEVQELLERLGSSALGTAATMAELIRRPELDYELLAPIDKARLPLPAEVIEQVNINIKYDGYIRRQIQQIEQFRKLENRKIPENINYAEVPSLRNEARQKLEQFRPISIGQASRISGVSPAHVSVLLVYLTQANHAQNRE